MNLTKEYSPSFIRASFDSFSQLKKKNKHFLLLRLFPRLFKQNSFEIRRNHGYEHLIDTIHLRVLVLNINLKPNIYPSNPYAKYLLKLSVVNNHKKPF